MLTWCGYFDETLVWRKSFTDEESFWAACDILALEAADDRVAAVLSLETLRYRVYPSESGDMREGRGTTIRGALEEIEGLAPALGWPAPVSESRVYQD